jgi:RNA polymerase sigma-70 factor (ECF subfamily)
MNPEIICSDGRKPDPGDTIPQKAGTGIGRNFAENCVLQPSDMDLLRAAARGDASAFHTLVDRHAGYLYRLASYVSRRSPDAEDIVQETLVGAFTGMKRFDGRSSVKTWLTRILMQQASRAWRRSKRRMAFDIEAAANSESDDAALSVQSGSTAVDKKIDVAAVLEALNPEHREVLVLREMQGMSYAEIAEVLAIPVGTVESRIHRARAEVRRRLQEYLP